MMKKILIWVLVLSATFSMAAQNNPYAIDDECYKYFREAENLGYVTYAVTDTGPGVPPEKADAIFERFTKLNEFAQGTGLGLSICRDIADRMGAKVYLDTDYTGKGARFVFLVPLTPPEIK